MIGFSAVRAARAVAALGLALCGGFTAELVAQERAAPPRQAYTAAPVPSSTELEEFRQTYLTLAVILDQLVAPGARTPGADPRVLEERVQALDPESLAALYESYQDPGELQAVVRLLARQLLEPSPAGATTPRVIVGTNSASFPPPYPTGGTYSAFTATLSGLGALSDSNGDGLLNDERCSANHEAGIQLALAIEKVAAATAQALCDSLVVILGEGTNAPFCIAAGVANLALAATEIAESQCSLQDALVDSAEVEAAFENTRILVDALTCSQVDAPRRGHGCDGADENCDLVADECDEDAFAPAVHIDGAVALPWFESHADAAAAVAEASSAVDDCQSVSLGAPSLVGACAAVSATVSAQDACGNSSSAATVVRVDGTPPAISLGVPPATCFTSVAAAELGVLASASVADDCATFTPDAVQLHSAVTECSLRIRAEVADDAGNTGSAAVTVRVDDQQPEVVIERLLLGFRGEVLGFQTPACYSTVAEAEAAVLQVTRFADNCSATEKLARTVFSSGDACSLLVASQAVDECGIANSDAVNVRVDAESPVVECSVALDKLSPGNHGMVDVGFSFTAGDNCSAPALRTEVTVTSDESTASASGAGGATFAPDAEILRDPSDGTVLGVMLRAENGSQGDGRVYKIRVAATDACGNAGEAVCRVSVPRTPSRPAVDNGPLYDATAVN